MSVLLMQILIFTVCSFVNVMLSTFKSIITVKGGDWAAGIINGVSYGFYNIIVQQITNYPLYMTVIITTATNVIGVTITKKIMRRLEKDKVWKISVTTQDEKSYEMIPARLKELGIGCNYFRITNKKGVVEIFSDSQKESADVRKILNDYNVKYFVSESKTL